jgi:hypothetical protein
VNLSFVSWRESSAGADASRIAHCFKRIPVRVPLGRCPKKRVSARFAQTAQGMGAYSAKNPIVQRLEQRLG